MRWERVTRYSLAASKLSTQVFWPDTILLHSHMVPISLSRKTPRHNQQTNVRSQFWHSVLRFPQLLQQHCGHRFSYCSKGRWRHTGLSLWRSFCLTNTLKYQSQSPLLKPPWTLSHAPWAAQGPKPRSPAHTVPCSLLIPTHMSLLKNLSTNSPVQKLLCLWEIVIKCTL